MRFVAPTYAEGAIECSAQVVRADADGVLFGLEVRGAERTAMSGTLEIPFPHPSREDRPAPAPRSGSAA